MGSIFTFKKGIIDPSAASGLTLGEPAFNTVTKKFFIGLGTGITAAWVGATITGASADIQLGLTGSVPTASAVKNYITALETIGDYSAAITIGSTAGTAHIRNPNLKLGNTTASILTSSGSTNDLTIQPYGSLILTGATAGGYIATNPKITISNTAQGYVTLEGGDLYLGLKGADAGNPDTSVNIIFEGASANAFETTLTVTDPTANRTITLPDATGTVALTSSVVTSFNGNVGAIQGVSAAVAGTGISISGATGSVTITNIGVQTFNGLTGAVTGITAGGINTFTQLNSFSAGISASGGVTFTGNVTISGFTQGVEFKADSALITFGDINSVGNSSKLIIDDSTNIVEIQNADLRARGATFSGDLEVNQHINMNWNGQGQVTQLFTAKNSGGLKISHESGKQIKIGSGGVANRETYISVTEDLAGVNNTGEISFGWTRTDNPEADPVDYVSGIFVFPQSSGVTGNVLRVQSHDGNTSVLEWSAVIGATGATGATGPTGPTGAIPTDYVISFNGATGAVTGASLGANTFTALNTFSAGISASGATLGVATATSLSTGDLTATGSIVCDSVNPMYFGDFSAAGNSTLVYINDSGANISIGDSNLNSTTISLYGVTTLSAGSATKIPVTMTSGAIATTPVAGGLEYNGKAFFTTPASGRGVSPSIMFSSVQADFTLIDGTTAQNAFPIPQDTITLPAATTYFFDGKYIINSGTTTHITSMGFTGTATITACTFTTISVPLSAPSGTAVRAQDMNYFSGVTGGNFNATNTSAFNVVNFEGMVRILAAGTFIPQITFSAAPGGTNLMKVGSYIRLYPVGAGTATFIGNIA